MTFSAKRPSWWPKAGCSAFRFPLYARYPDKTQNKPSVPRRAEMPAFLLHLSDAFAGRTIVFCRLGSTQPHNLQLRPCGIFVGNYLSEMFSCFTDYLYFCILIDTILKSPNLIDNYNFSYTSNLFKPLNIKTLKLFYS